MFGGSCRAKLARVFADVCRIYFPSVASLKKYLIEEQYLIIHPYHLHFKMAFSYQNKDDFCSTVSTLARKPLESDSCVCGTDLS